MSSFFDGLPVRMQFIGGIRNGAHATEPAYMQGESLGPELELLLNNRTSMMGRTRLTVRSVARASIGHGERWFAATVGRLPTRLLRISAAIGILITFPFATGQVAEAEGRKAVLILNSYHWGFAWTDAQVDGMMEVLSTSDLRPAVYLEHMDVLRQPTPYRDKILVDYLQSHFRSNQLDLVVTTDDAALAFVLRHHAALFPVVFGDAAEYDIQKGDWCGSAMQIHHRWNEN